MPRALGANDGDGGEGGHVECADAHTTSASLPYVASVARNYTTCLDLRMALRNRVRAHYRIKPDDKMKDKVLLAMIAERGDHGFLQLLQLATEQENFARRTLQKAMRDTEQWAYFAPIRGIAEVAAALLVLRLGDRTFPEPSNLWSFMGLTPDWETRRGPGMRNRALCMNLGDILICSRNPVYHPLYTERRAYEEARNEAGDYADQAARALGKDWSEDGRKSAAYKAYAAGLLPGAHLHARARRYIVKRFLKRIWRDFDLAHRAITAGPALQPHAVAEAPEAAD